MSVAQRKRWARSQTQIPNAKSFMAGPEHPNWTGSEASYGAMHQRLKKLKTGVCSICSVLNKTEMALIHGRGDRADESGQTAGVVYSVRVEDYIEMCVACHRAYDHGTSENYDQAVRYVRSIDLLRECGLL